MFKMVKKHKSIFLYITLIAIAIPIIVLVPVSYTHLYFEWDAFGDGSINDKDTSYGLSLIHI